MSRILTVVACVAAAAVTGCSQTREVAVVPSVAESRVVVPTIQTDVFADNPVERAYRQRLAEQPPIPLGDRDSYVYYERKVTRY